MRAYKYTSKGQGQEGAAGIAERFNNSQAGGGISPLASAAARAHRPFADGAVDLDVSSAEAEREGGCERGREGVREGGEGEGGDGGRGERARGRKGRKQEKADGERGERERAGVSEREGKREEKEGARAKEGERERKRERKRCIKRGASREGAIGQEGGFKKGRGENRWEEWR
eukprot:4711319-Pleurochrysis_carterae.AAC.1